MSDFMLIVIEEDTPRRRRKINKKRFRDQVDRENFWMVHTKKRIEKALKVCDEWDQDLDEDQERLSKRRNRVEEQRDILQGAREYIISCGAIEQKITRRWENS